MGRWRTFSWALAATLAACGSEAPAPPPAAKPVPEAPGSADVPRGAREVLTDDDEAYHRGQALTPRDTPLTVGDRAPPFDGLRAQSLTVLVFFRGAW